MARENDRQLQQSNINTWTQIITNFILSGAAIIGLAVNVYIYQDTVAKNQQLNRPYYSIDGIEIQPSVDKVNIYIGIFSLSNKGNTPAFNINTKYQFTNKGKWILNDESSHGIVRDPKSDNTMWIMLTQEDLESLVWENKANRLAIRMEYTDLTGELYCNESRYFSVKSNDKYLLALASSETCNAY